jgi:ferrous-iron efflux pump FieF
MPHPTDAVDAQHSRLVKLASSASVVVVIVMVTIKLAAWFMTGSVSLLASLLDSTMDAAASIFNFVAIRYALQPADEEHRFGHGKAESIASLVQSAFITGSAAFLWLHAISRIMEPHEVHQTYIGIIVMIVSLAMTYGLVALQRYVVKRTHNAAIHADSTHYIADALVTISVIVVLLLNPYLWKGADAVLGILISLYIFYSAFGIAYCATQTLLDHELPFTTRQQITEIVEAHPKVIGLHELRTREAGHMQFIQLHIDLDKHIDLQQAHDVADEVEAAVVKAFPNADVLIHPDPV